MKWTDEGIVVNVKPFNEKEYILTLFCENNGKRKGLFKNNKSQNGTASISFGDIGQASWFGRLQDQLGKFSFERKYQTSLYCFQCNVKNAAFNHLFDIINILPDNHVYSKIYNHFLHINLEMKNFTKRELLIQLCLFELILLSELGFGFDLSHCAVSGVSDTYYISPQSGQCVSKEIGTPYHAKLFIIPSFWIEEFPNTETAILKASNYSYLELKQSFAITYFFIKKHIFENDRDFSFSRQQIIQWLENQSDKS